MDKNAPLIHIECRKTNSSIICRQVDDNTHITIEVDENSATIVLNQVTLKHLIAGLSKGIDNDLSGITGATATTE